MTDESRQKVRLLQDPCKRVNYDMQALFDQQNQLKKTSLDYCEYEIKLYEGATTKRSFGQDSLFIMSTENPIRRFAQWVAFSNAFERFILLMIVGNCIFMAMDDPNAEPSDDEKIVELTFLVIFTIEALFKIVALGFVLEINTYLRDAWNVLDFIVVIIGWVGQAGAGSNVSALRTIRLLRPLRTINKVPEMKILVNSIIKSLPLLVDILFLFGFFLILFGIIGLQSYAGLFLQRCFDKFSHEVADWDSGELCYIGEECEEGEIDCNFSGCDEDQYCEKTHVNPDDGVTAFDNIFQSILTVFTAITLEGWTQNMYWAREVSDNKYIGDMYFIIMIFLGAFIIVNLAIAVQYDTFAESKQEEKDNAPLEEEEEEDPDIPKGEMRFKPALIVDERGDTIEPCCFKFRLCMFEIVTGGPFNLIVTILILVNTIIMASDHYPMTYTHIKFNEISNIVLTALFAIEMIMKLIGLSPKGYVSDGMNIFDGVLVIVGIIDILVLGDSASGVTVLRAFRLFRVFKLAKSWKKLNELIGIMVKSFIAISYLGVLVMLILFIFALMGTQFFSKQLKDGDESPRSNFDNIGWSMVTIFQILTGENWNEIMYMAVNQVGWQSAVYFVMLVLIGNYLLFNLFLAILLSQFEGDEEEEEDDEEEEEDPFAEGNKENQASGRADTFSSGAFAVVDSDQCNSDHSGKGLKTQGIITKKTTPEDNDISPDYGADYAADYVTPREDNQFLVVNGDQNGIDTPTTTGVVPRTNTKKETAAAAKSAKIEKLVASKSEPKILMSGKSLYIFSMDNPIRKFGYSILNHPYYDEFIYGLITASSLVLAFDEPNVSEYKKSIINILHLIFLGCFICEALLKTIVLGFVAGPKAYLKDSWNRLDFFIVVIGVADLMITQIAASSGVDLRFLRALRALRALRPLRMVSKSEGMKIVVSSVMSSLPEVFNVFLIMILFFLIFGILGVIFFKGGLYACTDPNIDNQDDCEGYFIAPDTGVIVQRQWLNPPFHFDNIFMSMLTLFEIASLEMWPDYMYPCIDVVGPGKEGKRNNNPGSAIFFIIFIFLITFFIMNLFVGVVTEQFYAMKADMEGTAFLSPKQHEWVKVQQLLMKCQPRILYRRPDESPTRAWLFDLVQNPTFEYTILGIICLNVVFMMMFHYDQPGALTTALYIANIVFVIIFFIEFVMKIVGLGYKCYFADSWNTFDFIIVWLSVIGVILISQNIEFINPTVLRVLRVGRLIRIVKTSKGLRRIFFTLITSLPSLLDVGALLLLLFFVYGVAGMDLFSGIKYGDHINKHANFGSFYHGLITLVRASTGESWNGLMHDCMQREEDYGCEGVEECGAWYYAVPYWVSFFLIAAAVFLNIFIAVILDNFMKVCQSEKQDVLLTDQDLAKYERTWQQYCPLAEHWLHAIHLPKFLKDLPEPLGFNGQKEGILQVLRVVKNCNINEDGGYVHFAHLLWGLAHSIHGANMKSTAPVESLNTLAAQLQTKFHELRSKDKGGKVLDALTDKPANGNTADRIIAGLIILDYWKKYKAKMVRIKHIEKFGTAGPEDMPRPAISNFF